MFPQYSYKRWVNLRNKSKDKYNKKLCYCGHTSKCDCADPCKDLFVESVNRGSLILCDKDNGWNEVNLYDK
jgi:hypothetical protein